MKIRRIEKNVFHKMNIINKTKNVGTIRTSKIHSIKTKFITTFICFALIPFVFLCITYTIISKKAIRVTSSKLSTEVVHQATNNLDSSLSVIQQDIIDFGSNTLLNSGYLKDLSNGDKKEQLSALRQLTPIIFSYTSSQDLLEESCVVFPKIDQCIGSIHSHNITDLMTHIENISDSSFHWETSDKLPENEILIIKQFIDLGSNNLKYYICSRYSLASIIDYVRSLDLLKDSKVFLINTDQSVLFSTDSECTEIPEYIKSELDKDYVSFISSDYLVSYGTLSNNWKLVVETPYASLTEQLDLSFPIVLIILIVTLMIAIVLSYFYANSFSKPIIQLKKLMEKAKHGDLTIKAPVKGEDEIAELCISFNHMIQNIKELVAQTNQIVIQTVDNSNTLSDSAEHSIETIKHLSSAVSEIAEGTTHQALDTQKSTQHMHDLSLQMETVTNKTSTLLSNTDNAKNIIENATYIIDSLTCTMNSSITMTNDIGLSINNLNTLTHNIEDIMSFIDNISEQTNLLALNASIEAARAGDAGKGFAVVATEVRHLADQSKAYTLDVRTALNAINTKMSETVSLAQNSKSILSKQQSVVDETHELFNQIVDILSNMLTELNDIGMNITNMRSLKDIMVDQMSNIASVTEESAASTQEVSSLAIEQEGIIAHFSELSRRLTDSMDKLTSAINNFTI